MFWNYEGITIAYVKSRRSEDYLGTEKWLKTIRVKIGVFGIKFLKIRAQVIKLEFVKENEKTEFRKLNCETIDFWKLNL